MKKRKKSAMEGKSGCLRSHYKKLSRRSRLAENQDTLLKKKSFRAEARDPKKGVHPLSGRGNA